MKTTPILFVIVTITFLSCNRQGNSLVSIPEPLHEELEANKEFDEAVTEPKHYDSVCRLEYQNGQIYPSNKPITAKLHSDWGRSWKLNQAETQVLISTLNDSANYEWGELGTPEINYYFTFHNDEGNCIGITTVDLEGMVYSYPSLNRMKWGAFKDMAKIDKIIEGIKD